MSAQAAIKSSISLLDARSTIAGGVRTVLLELAGVPESVVTSAVKLASKCSDAQLVSLYTQRGEIYCLELPLRVMGKPRMTQSDKWKVRPVVARSRLQSDQLRRALNTQTKYGTALRVSWVAIFQTTAKSPGAGSPHRARPDRDNIDKLILDALFREDAGVAFGSMAKYWGAEDVLLLALEGLEDAE